jgi:hypothetical protein
MDWGHLHLMLNHVPVLGAPALLALLAWSWGRKQPEGVRLALWSTVALGAIALAVYLTGEAAEEMVESLPTFNHDMVEEHEAVALAATVLLVVTSIAAGLALWVSRSGGRVYRWTIVIVLSGLVAGTAAVAATAWTGGPIGHPEIR